MTTTNTCPKTFIWKGERYRCELPAGHNEICQCIVGRPES